MGGGGVGSEVLTRLNLARTERLRAGRLCGWHAECPAEQGYLLYLAGIHQAAMGKSRRSFSRKKPVHTRAVVGLHPK